MHRHRRIIITNHQVKSIITVWLVEGGLKMRIIQIQGRRGTKILYSGEHHVKYLIGMI